MGSNFSTGDSWRLSSGILNIDSGVDDKNYIDWPQESGSVYRLYKQREGKLSLYNEIQVNYIIEEIQKVNYKAEIISLDNIRQ